MITLLTMLAVAKLKSRQGSASLVLILQSLTTPCRTLEKNKKQVKYLLLQQQDQGVAIACVAHLQIGRSSGAAFHSCPSKHVEALQHSSQVDREADVFPLFSSRLEIILLEDITPHALNFKNLPIASSWDLNICIKAKKFWNFQQKGWITIAKKLNFGCFLNIPQHFWLKISKLLSFDEYIKIPKAGK